LKLVKPRLKSRRLIGAESSTLEHTKEIRNGTVPQAESQAPVHSSRIGPLRKLSTAYARRRRSPKGRRVWGATEDQGKRGGLTQTIVACSRKARPTLTAPPRWTRISESAIPPTAMHNTFSVYGDRVAVPEGIRIPHATRNAPSTAQSITFFQAETVIDQRPPDASFKEVFSCVPLRADIDLLRWDPYCQFEVRYRERIARFALNGPLGKEAFEDYYLSQVLSFFFIYEKREPLHASVVADGDRAVALLGESGSGKSSMVAALLASGWKLVTDDLAMVHIDSVGCTVHPGLPRLKLHRSVASRYFPAHAMPVASRTLSAKLVWHVDKEFYHHSPVTLSCCVLLSRARHELGAIAVLSECSRAEAFLRLLRNTYNTVKTNLPRARAQFGFFSQLANSVPVFKLDYRDNLACLDDVAARLADQVRQRA